MASALSQPQAPCLSELELQTPQARESFRDRPLVLQVPPTAAGAPSPTLFKPGGYSLLWMEPTVPWGRLLLHFILRAGSSQLFQHTSNRDRDER